MDSYVDMPKILDRFREDQKQRELIAQYESDIKRANKQASIARREMAKERERSKKYFKVIFIAGALTGALATVGIISVYNKITKIIKISSAENDLKKIAEERLVEEGLAKRNENGKITILDNKISDYRCLDLTNASPLETHIYKEVLGSEFNDAIQTASYDNGYSYYTGAHQWYTYNGFFDKDTREISDAEEFVFIKPLLLEAYNNDCKKIVRTAEEVEKSISRVRSN